VKWAKEIWWHVWVRQSHTNYVGMWKKRFKKEDRKAEKLREEEGQRVKARDMAEKEKEKIARRLRAMNARLGLLEKV
jgi:glutathione S-transferase